MQTQEPLELDVRPLLARGEEPFGAIMQAVASLAAGQPLLLRVPFEPQPLYPIMSGRGYTANARQNGEADWEIVFTPQGGQQDARELDLRKMEPPGPFQRGLEEASRLGRDL